MIVLSKNGNFRCVLTDAPDGVFISVEQKCCVDAGLPRPVFKRIYATTIDCPMHVALDRAVELVEKLI